MAVRDCLVSIDWGATVETVVVAVGPPGRPTTARDVARAVLARKCLPHHLPTVESVFGDRGGVAVRAPRLSPRVVAWDAPVVSTGVVGPATSLALRVPSRLLGGKGGFGAMLRSMGKAHGATQTRDFGACRDLAGRRLRHVNNEIALQKWHEARARKEAAKQHGDAAAGSSSTTTEAAAAGASEDASTRPKHGIAGWHLAVPSWAELPKARKSKAAVRAEARTRDWRDEERAVAASGAQTKSFLGVVTMVDTIRGGFCVVDKDCYVPYAAQCRDDDDWDRRPPRVGERLRVWAAWKPKGRNLWAAYKAERAQRELAPLDDASSAGAAAAADDDDAKAAAAAAAASSGGGGGVRRSQHPAVVVPSKEAVDAAVSAGLDAAKRRRKKKDTKTAAAQTTEAAAAAAAASATVGRPALGGLFLQGPTTTTTTTARHDAAADGRASSRLGVLSGRAGLLANDAARGASAFATVGVVACGPVGPRRDPAKQLEEAAAAAAPDDAAAAATQSWYYEVELLSEGVAQLGWADAARFAGGDDDEGDGVGDDAASWAFDGCRLAAWTDGDARPYGGATAWARGDVVGCVLDLERRTMSFTKNGEDLGVAFADLPPDAAYVAALSLEDDEAVRVVLDADRMRHKPAACRALADSTSASRRPGSAPGAAGVAAPRAASSQDDDVVLRADETIDPTTTAPGGEPPRDAAPAAAEPERQTAGDADADADADGNADGNASATPAATDDATAATEAADKPVTPPPEPVADLEPFRSPDDLAALGLDVLKASLLARGCKCGGTLRERALRLWSTRGKDRAQWDPKILAASRASPKRKPRT